MAIFSSYVCLPEGKWYLVLAEPESIAPRRVCAQNFAVVCAAYWAFASWPPEDPNLFARRVAIISMILWKAMGFLLGKCGSFLCWMELNGLMYHYQTWGFSWYFTDNEATRTRIVIKGTMEVLWCMQFILHSLRVESSRLNADLVWGLSQPC